MFGYERNIDRNYDGVTTMRNKRNNRLILGITQDDIPMIGNQMKKLDRTQDGIPVMKNKRKKKKALDRNQVDITIMEN